MDSRLYPHGSGVPEQRYIRSSTGKVLVKFGELKFQRTRVTLAQANAGFTLLPALKGVKWCLRDMAMIAIGGAAAGGTSLDILGTRGGAAVRPLVTAVAALTQNTLVRAGATNAVILAAGASFTELDANTAVSVTKQSGGSALTTATHFDIFLWYTAEAVS
jgi:hypothetical protein